MTPALRTLALALAHARTERERAVAALDRWRTEYACILHQRQGMGPPEYLDPSDWLYGPLTEDAGHEVSAGTAAAHSIAEDALDRVMELGRQCLDALVAEVTG